MTSGCKPYESFVNIKTRKKTWMNLIPNFSLLLRKDAKKKVGHCSKFCWYKPFEPLVVDVAYYCQNLNFSVGSCKVFEE